MIKFIINVMIILLRINRLILSFSSVQDCVCVLRKEIDNHCRMMKYLIMKKVMKKMMMAIRSEEHTSELQSQR